MSATVHQLKITLGGIRPPIWRRIEVASDLTLGELSGILEAAMGWYGDHLHAFDVDGTRYETHKPHFESFGLDESKHCLGTVLSSVGSKMRFDYDFGDGWEHNVVVEAINPPDGEATYPRCIKGKRACPPEDCGGPWGYADLLEVIADPKHPDHEERREWLPLDFDPEWFDLEETELDMRTPRPTFDW
ncbi:MAG: plasmid pRiA4b ORF-3 family protein [Actinomycetota bacterium]|nr:plasmid pRiA4b ORF-3 family protein [Actinomycetota bacterium]